MIELTAEQQQALTQAGTRPVRVLHRAANTEYVLIRADVYDRLQALLADDTVYATGDLVDRIMAEDDANDPYLDNYQHLPAEDKA